MIDLERKNRRLLKGLAAVAILLATGTILYVVFVR